MDFDELLWLDECLSTGSKVPTMSGDRIRKHRFSSLMQKCLARLRMKRLERTVFRSAFPSPVGSGAGLGKKYTKSGAAILVIQQPARVTAPSVG